MYSLLPQENINKLVSEYRARLFVVVAGMIGSAILISVVILIPSYVYIHMAGAEISLESDTLRKQTQEAGATELESQLSESNTIIKEFAIFEHQISRSEIVKKLGSKIVPGITINTFTIIPEEKSAAQKEDETKRNESNFVFSVQITGEALTRDSLVAFTENLNNDQMYSAVGLPISNLAKSSKIPFSLSFKATVPYMSPF